MAQKTQQPLQSLTREQFWRRHIDQWQDSGLSKMGYCRENELPYHQLIYWCDKFRQMDDAGSDVESSFVNVSLAPIEPKPAATLSVELPNGICIAGVCAKTIALVPQLLRCL
ncbi:MAG: hypothetical protein AB8B79_19720 [Granulosicoccus sp.]